MRQVKLCCIRPHWPCCEPGGNLEHKPPVHEPTTQIWPVHHLVRHFLLAGLTRTPTPAVTSTAAGHTDASIRSVTILHPCCPSGSFALVERARYFNPQCLSGSEKVVVKTYKPGLVEPQDVEVSHAIMCALRFKCSKHVALTFIYMGSIPPRLPVHHAHSSGVRHTCEMFGIAYLRRQAHDRWMAVSAVRCWAELHSEHHNVH